MAREFSELPDWMKKDHHGFNRAMSYLIAHSNALDAAGKNYPYHDVPEEEGRRIYKESRDAKKNN